MADRANSIPMSRRLAIGALLASPLAAAMSSPAGASASADASKTPDADTALFELGYQLLCTTVGYDRQTGAEFERTYERAADLVDQIIDMPATSLAGLRVKALAWRWCNAFDIDEMAEATSGTVDNLVIGSILKDLGVEIPEV